MVAINRCILVLVLILTYTSLAANYSYLRIIRFISKQIYLVEDYGVFHAVIFGEVNTGILLNCFGEVELFGLILPLPMHCAAV